MENIKSKVIPKSLFLSAIFNLGRVPKSGSTLVNLNTFHLDTMVWSTVISQWSFRFPQICLGSVDLERLTEHKGTLNNFQMQSGLWEKYKTSVLKETEAISQTAEQHTRKMVQMHHLARNFVAQLTQVVMNQDLRDLFGETFSYKTIYLGKLPDGEFVTVEEFVEGKMGKFVNTDGTPCGNKEDVILQKSRMFGSLLLWEFKLPSHAFRCAGGWLWAVWPRGASAEFLDSQRWSPVHHRELFCQCYWKHM